MNGGWLDTLPGVAKKTLLRSIRPEHRRRARLVTRGLDLRSTPRTLGVWAIAMVKNEADIIRATVTHTFEQGIDRMLIVDNGSTDGTRDLLADLSREFRISIGDDRETAYYQDHKMTALAAHARRHGADWVVPIDADEFWFAKDRSVGDHLRSLRATTTRASAILRNVFPIAGNEHPTSLRDGPLRLDLRPHVLPKVAARTHPLLWIGMGNHSALRPGWMHASLHIAHLPWRSFEQLARKVRQGAAAYAATDLDEHLGGHWRRQAERADAELRATWSELLEGRGPGDLGWRPSGQFRTVDLGRWRTWDPDGIVPDLERQLSEI